MKINICIPFNDLKPPSNIGMVVGKKPSYYDQLVYLIKSIKKNWDSSLLDYSIHAFHSRELQPSKKNELESLGCEVIHDSDELIPYLCRENIFKHDMDGDYTLVLDTDMLVLKTPTFEYERDIYVMCDIDEDGFIYVNIDGEIEKVETDVLLYSGGGSEGRLIKTW